MMQISYFRHLFTKVQDAGFKVGTVDYVLFRAGNLKLFRF